MNEETRQEMIEIATGPETAATVESMAKETVAAESEIAAEETAAMELEVAEFMDDYVDELEASFKEFDEKHDRIYVEDEFPDAEEWQELWQMPGGKAIIRVKVKETTKGGAIIYADKMKVFVPTSQLSLDHVENLEELAGQYLEVRVIVMDPETKRLILSVGDILKGCQEVEESRALESYKAGDIVEGTVDSIKPHGVLINPGDGVSRPFHAFQISAQRVKHPSVVLKEGQKIRVKILSMVDGKIGLSMRMLEETEVETNGHIGFDYKGDGTIFTGLGDLPKDSKLQCFTQ